MEAHEERIDGLNSQCEEFINADLGDPVEMAARRDQINIRFTSVKVSINRLLPFAPRLVTVDASPPISEPAGVG